MNTAVAMALRALPRRWSKRLVLDPTKTYRGTPCWLWSGRWNSGNGYGKTKKDGKCVMAHRAIFEFFRGAIPGGLILDHLCRRRECCNPWHLEPVTHATNTHRGEAVLYRRADDGRQDAEVLRQDAGRAALPG